MFIGARMVGPWQSAAALTRDVMQSNCAKSHPQSFSLVANAVKLRLRSKILDSRMFTARLSPMSAHGATYTVGFIRLKTIPLFSSFSRRHARLRTLALRSAHSFKKCPRLQGVIRR